MDNKLIKILLIEDDHADQLIFKRILKKTGIASDLVVADTVTGGSSMLKSNDIEIVFCDYNLPDGNALSLLKTLDADKIALVVITSQADIQMATESLMNGASDFITKDNINEPTLERVLTNIIRSKEQQVERQKLEKELEENFANTEAILNNTDDGIWSLDCDGKIVVMNEVARYNISNRKGYDVKIGDNFFENFPEIFTSVWRPMYNGALEGKQANSIDKYVIDNKFFYLEISCSPIYSGDYIKGATFFARDVTSREISRYKIEESEKNFRSIFESSDLPILIRLKDNDAILDLNEACSKLIGQPKEKLITNAFINLIPEALRANFMMEFNAIHANNNIVLETFLVSENKTEVPVSIRITEVAYYNKKSYLMFIQDISARLKKEQSLNEAKLFAEQTAEFKAQFLANMSHEIRTPLNAIIGFTTLLNESNLNEEQKKYVEIIDQAGNNLIVIINDILDLSKIQAGKLDLIAEEFDLHHLVNQTYQLHAKNAKKKGLEFNLNQNKNLPNFIVGDKNRLTQILNNLLSNAIKFTEKGKVELTCELVSSKANTAELKFAISDTGIGIPKDSLTSIFTDFSQIDSSLQRTQTGTGLGLAIVKELVRLMNGEIQVESTFGLGSKFSFTITSQIIRAAKISGSVDANRLPDFSHLKILLVEDNSVNILLAEKILGKIGIVPLLASNGLEGVEMVKKNNPDLILMDIQMPVMNGMDATREIRTFSKVPILAMTAHVLEEERHKYFDLGMNGFIPKPFKIEELITAITESLTVDKSSLAYTTNDYQLFSDMPIFQEIVEGDIKFARSLMSTYIQSSTIELEKFILAAKVNDQIVMANVAHKLRSSFIIFGFRELINRAAEIEQGRGNAELNLKFSQMVKESMKLIDEKIKLISV